MSILVIIGTKAQYIKMAPLIREISRRDLPCRLVFTGQHSETFGILEGAFGIRPADEVMVPQFEAATKLSLACWALKFWSRALGRIRSAQWRRSSICLVHGDTVSALFGAVAARLAGIQVAHVEAGLRSSRLFDPFPEEVVRRLVSAMSHVHFAPDGTAEDNLASTRGSVIMTCGNTLRDALRMALLAIRPVPETGGAGGYGVVSIHRNENLSSRTDFDLLMNLVVEASRVVPLKFVVHPATRERMLATGWYGKLAISSGVELVTRMDYPDFVRLLVGARLLMTDGGSNQEEASMLGIPTLLLRRTTERPDGLDDNIELSNLQPQVIRDFIARHASSTWMVRDVDGPSPSALIVDDLERRLS